MQIQDLIRSTLLFVAIFGLTLAVLAAVQQAPEAPEPRPSPAPSTAHAAPRLVVDKYQGVGLAFRENDFSKVEAILQKQIADGSVEARVLVGLYAHAAERFSEAVEHLQATGHYRGELQDWRLWAIASSAGEIGQEDLSHAALSRLVDDFSHSPLRSSAVALLARQAVEHNDWLTVLELDRTVNDDLIDQEVRLELARLAWQATDRIDSSEEKLASARRLLTEHPLIAAELRAVDVFRLEDGTVPWTTFLSSPDIFERGRSLLEAELPESALETLALTPDEDRDFEWHLLQARALTESHQGGSALDLLDPLSPSSPEYKMRLEWERASAALEAATARPGRRGVSSEHREQMRLEAHAHLENLARDEDSVYAIDALRILFADLLEAERFEEAISTLERLKFCDDADTTGALPLWGLGWKAFENRNYSSAIGYWSELGDLYPRSNYNRAGLYWSARSHEKLGNSERARELLEEVVSVDFTDIYRRYALARLESRAPEPGGESASEPWPEDPRLARPKMFHQLGLDEAALIELDARSESAEPRASAALRALILAAQGNRRQSIASLRTAFPVLGTPYQSLAPDRARHMYYPLDFAEIVREQARVREVPSHLVMGLIRQESAFDTSARSWAGAQGLMQIMPATGKELARRLGLRYSRDRLNDPEFSITLGTSYLRQVLEMFEGDEVLALAGYNAGPYRIKRLWNQAGRTRELDQFLEQLSYSETRHYVKRVLLFSDSYWRLYDAAG